MLKKLFAAGLLLLITATANAAPITGINGSFDVFGIGQTTLNANGEIAQVDFSLNSTLFPVLATGDYLDYFTSDSIFSVKNPLILSNIVGIELWTVEGFSFTGTSIRQNSTQGASTGLYIIGNVTHADFIATETEWFFSTQGLTNNSVNVKSFSSTVTSPAPVVTVAEPTSLAIFALGLMGFAARRKRKSV